MSRFMIRCVAHVTVCTIVALTSGCASLPQSCAAPSRMMASAEIIFGRNVRDRMVVSEAAFAEFVAAEVAPRFADGLTIVDGSGQWRNPHGSNVRERTKVMIVTFDDSARRHADLAAITDSYKRRFNQQSVLTQVRDVCVSF